MHMEVQVTSKVAQLRTLLATASRKVGPNGDVIWRILFTTKRHRCPKDVGNNNENVVWRCCAVLEPSWAEVGVLLAEVDPKYDGSKRCIRPMLGRSADSASYYSGEPALGRSPGRKCPLSFIISIPQEKLRFWGSRYHHFKHLRQNCMRRARDGTPRQETASLLRFRKVGAQWMARCGDLVSGLRRFHVVYSCFRCLLISYVERFK